jgi:predicted nuclease of predicted toxin-antitoxin system
MQPNNLEFWIDLNLPPAMAKWLQEDFQVSAKSFKELNFETEEDISIFKQASNRINTIVITTKDIDFKNLVNDINSPPKILYLNVGNISNKMLKEIIYKSFKEVLRIFSETDSSLIEITN